MMGERAATAGRRATAMLILTPVALAPAAAPAAGDYARSEIVRLCENKTVLLDRYLENQSTRDIEENGAEAAKWMIARAHELSRASSAGAAAEDGCKHIDEALRLITAAAASEREGTDADADKSYYLQRAGQFNAYLQAMSLTQRADWPGDVRERFATADLKFAEAAKHADDGDFAAARATIEIAYRELLEIIKLLNDGKLVVHELVFKTPQDEFQYERDRNRSFEMLLQIAVDEIAPSRELAAHITHVIDENTRHRTLASQLAEAGDPAQAIVEMELASRELAKALRLMGVMVWD